MLDERTHLFPCDSVNAHRKYSLSFLFSGLEPALGFLFCFVSFAFWPGELRLFSPEQSLALCDRELGGNLRGKKKGHYRRVKARAGGVFEGLRRVRITKK